MVTQPFDLKNCHGNDRLLILAVIKDDAAVVFVKALFSIDLIRLSVSLDDAREFAVDADFLFGQTIVRPVKVDAVGPFVAVEKKGGLDEFESYTAPVVGNMKDVSGV